MTPQVAAILAGGQSQRMGQDKASLICQGETLLARTARIAQEAGLTALIVGRARPDDWPLSDTPFTPDAFPEQGPLGGLATALQATNQDLLLLACDMPLLTAEALCWLKEQPSGRDGLAVRCGDQLEPLFSCYRPSLLPLIRTQMAAGRLSLRSLIAAGDFQTAHAPLEVAAALVNINTPEEWAQRIP